MSSDVSNNTSPVKGPKPTILFDNNEEEEDKTEADSDQAVEAAGDDVFLVDKDLEPSASPQSDERYFRPRVTPSACSDLIDFDSPYRP